MIVWYIGATIVLIGLVPQKKFSPLLNPPKPIPYRNLTYLTPRVETESMFQPFVLYSFPPLFLIKKKKAGFTSGVVNEEKLLLV